MESEAFFQMEMPEENSGSTVNCTEYMAKLNVQIGSKTVDVNPTNARGEFGAQFLLLLCFFTTHYLLPLELGFSK